MLGILTFTRDWTGVLVRVHFLAVRDGVLFSAKQYVAYGHAPGFDDE